MTEVIRRTFRRLDRLLFSSVFLHLILVVFLILSLAGCASFSGMPEPVIATAEAVHIPAEFMPREALRRYHAADDSERNGMTPREWRNAVVLVRMGAADARYHEFRINLSREVRGANFGIESTVLGLAGLATVSGEGTANALAAAIAALTGARASLSREVYFERTLPALIAGMEVSRLEIATRVLAGLGRPAAAYPLEVALLDALAYERAPSLDQAIQLVTADAAQEAARARQIYNNVTNQLGVIEEADLPTAEGIRNGLNLLENQAAGGDVTIAAAATAAIDQIVDELGLSVASTASAGEKINAVRIRTLTMTSAERQQFVEAMRGRGVQLWN